MDLRIWNGIIPYFCEDAETPNLFHTFFLDTEEALPCVVVLPGGGYGGHSPQEGTPIAEFFNSQGMHAVVVDYRVAPNRHPAPLSDVQRVVRLLRYHASEWKIDPARIVTCGFSAGGHLAASAILLPDAYTEAFQPDEIDGMDCLPNGAILGYPVISVEEFYGHTGSGKRLLGERYETEKSTLSLAQYVNESTPKVFLWHTSNDAVVNVKNSLIFGERLRDANVEFELHVYPHGHHGLGLALDRPDVRTWAPHAAAWVKKNI